MVQLIFILGDREVIEVQQIKENGKDISYLMYAEQVPEDLRRVVSQALAKSLSERFQDAEAFIAALAPIRQRYGSDRSAYLEPDDAGKLTAVQVNETIDANDDRARRIIDEQFPDREIVAIDAVSLTEDGGAIHCVTQQQPAAGGNGRRRIP